MLHLVVFSGLCNRLFAIVSGLRYARQTLQEVTIYWYIPVARYGLPYKGQPGQEHFNHFFKKIPNITLKTWVPTLIEQLKKENPKIEILHDGTKVIPPFMGRDPSGNIVFPSNFEEMVKSPLKFPRKQDVAIIMPTHPFGFDDETYLPSPIDEEHRYPVKAGLRKKNQYELELSKFARKLEPISSIQQIIDQLKSEFEKANNNKANNNSNNSGKKIGVHIRRTDMRTEMEQEEFDVVIDSLIIRHRFDTIYVCSDDYDLQTNVTKRNPNVKLLSYNDATKTVNNLLGAQKSMVDLYLLAECDKIYGTRSSSFSYFSWMLANDSSTFEIVF